MKSDRMDYFRLWFEVFHLETEYGRKHDTDDYGIWWKRYWNAYLRRKK